MKKSTKPLSEFPFTGTKIYYSGSIGGVAESDLSLPEQLVTYMKHNGADVLDEHVAIPHKGDAFLKTMASLHGLSLEAWKRLANHEQDLKIYEHDIWLVDKATHVIALVNSPSLGVGMELQEAIRKPEMGLPITPILGLVHNNLIDKISSMVRGAVRKYPHFTLKTYVNVNDAQKSIYEFLTSARG